LVVRRSEGIAERAGLESGERLGVAFLKGKLAVGRDENEGRPSQRRKIAYQHSREELGYI